MTPYLVDLTPSREVSMHRATTGASMQEPDSKRRSDQWFLRVQGRCSGFISHPSPPTFRRRPLAPASIRLQRASFTQSQVHLRYLPTCLQVYWPLCQRVGGIWSTHSSCAFYRHLRLVKTTFIIIWTPLHSIWADGLSSCACVTILRSDLILNNCRRTRLCGNWQVGVRLSGRRGAAAALPWHTYPSIGNASCVQSARSLSHRALSLHEWLSRAPHHPRTALAREVPIGQSGIPARLDCRDESAPSPIIRWRLSTRRWLSLAFPSQLIPLVRS
ncbi:hypothetical protein CONLIGDRAFT_399250 [Coniochaeta ligniaria NRRL 30616]|uniref:Uncharacterized protein n=1 Tax=Coniochaeta ligniaria NRRL 30616 TaxID=1408157 RepID=A0A1J7IMW3_9PEZI|nr:hypothetical protein CONLIGDRAFT_399250 [Coniochaeta ligniaria NRRL 30616]